MVHEWIYECTQLTLGLSVRQRQRIPRRASTPGHYVWIRYNPASATTVGNVLWQWCVEPFDFFWIKIEVNYSKHVPSGSVVFKTYFLTRLNFNLNRLTYENTPIFHLALSVMFRLLVSTLLIGAANGLFFHIKQGEVKCFVEEVPDETMVSGMDSHIPFFSPLSNFSFSLFCHVLHHQCTISACGGVQKCLLSSRLKWTSAGGVSEHCNVIESF